MLLKSFIFGIIMQVSYTIGPFLLPTGIKDKPFQGKIEQITAKKLPDGEITYRTTHHIVYRAVDGSSRFEQYENSEKNRIFAIAIYNSSGEEFYFLDLKSKSVFVKPISKSNSESELLTFDGNNIGEKVIENFVCRGYRRKQEENNVFEYWVSEELNQIMLAKSVFGNETSTLRFFDIERVEPNSKMFVVPKGYKLIKIE